MIVRSALALVLAVLCGCSVAHQSSEEVALSREVAARPLVTQGREDLALPELAPAGIAWEVRSWGRLIASYTIDAAGNVDFRRKKEGGGMSNYDILITRFSAGPEAFAQLRDMVGPIARRTGGKEMECGDMPTDGPYGRLRWRWEGAEGALRLQYFCQTVDGRETLRLIDEVEKKVEGWAASRPVTQIHQVRQPARAGQ
jgi:hypothetical protein